MIERLREIINEYFIGKSEVAENVLICLLAGGHVLIEDVPGVGKTTLVKTLAASVDLDFGRIQFTPDTLPSDVTGVSVLNMKTGEFEYREGSVMHQILLADEINRTSPKTQAALLEAMSERKVTVDDRTYDLPKPFMMIATQNPVEFVGTYPLPEAQLDRFMMKLSIGYPSPEDEVLLTRRFLEGKTADTIKSVISSDELLKIMDEVRNVKIADKVLQYAEEIIGLTRQEKRFVRGVSSRAMIMMMQAARAHAYLADRQFVTPDDIKAVAVSTLHHRITLSYDAKIAGEDIDKVLHAVVLKAKVPMV
ncbi:MAG: MoxR family ATPase [Lachnospiraceae bacterium]|nr:MoxR family ATPase [Lachnospiraceae bacterium]MBP1584623.1 MoxR family ATPase [Lachnospiraceae bacterium]